MNKIVATKLVRRMSRGRRQNFLRKLEVMEATAWFVGRPYDRQLLQHVRTRLEEGSNERSDAARGEDTEDHVHMRRLRAVGVGFACELAKRW